jgi:hypothetical protein
VLRTARSHAAAAPSSARRPRAAKGGAGRLPPHSAAERLWDAAAAFASRLAHFDPEALARTKFYVDHLTLPADSELPPALADFFELLGRPAQQAQFARLEALGLNTESDLERFIGRRVVESSRDA